MIRLLIADDHALIREGLRKVFDRERDIELAAVASNSAETLALAREQELDVAVLDFNMPGRNGLDTLVQLRAHKPQLPVLILSMMPERELAVRVFRAGGAGFVSKESAADEIVTAVRAAAAGRRYVSPSIAELLAAGLGGDTDHKPHHTLSNREIQVLRLIAAGRPIREIAVELTLSPNTVATYRRRILEKLDLSSTAELVRYAIDHSLGD